MLLVWNKNIFFFANSFNEILKYKIRIYIVYLYKNRAIIKDIFKLKKYLEEFGFTVKQGTDALHRTLKVNLLTFFVNLK